MTMSKLNRLRVAFSLRTRSSAMIIIRLKPSAKDARLLKRFILYVKNATFSSAFLIFIEPGVCCLLTSTTLFNNEKIRERL